MLALFMGLGLWVRVGIVAAIVGAFALAIWFVYHSIYETGYRAAVAKLQPQIDKLTVDLKNSQADLSTAVAVNKTFATENDRLAGLLRDQSFALDKLRADAITAQNEARAALERVAANQKRYSAELARLKSIVNGPPMTEGDSDEADSILRAILRDRLSVGPRAEAPGDHPARADRGGEDRSGPAVYQQGGPATSAAANQARFEDGQQGAGGGRGGARLTRAG